MLPVRFRAQRISRSPWSKQALRRVPPVSVCAAVRGTLVKEKSFPDELAVQDEEPRIGVFVCNCGINIGGIADVPAVAAYARELGHVVYTEEPLFACSQDAQEKMVEVINEQRLNRIVVAACTPRTHEPLFQETIRNAGLNAYLFEMANIRNQCTWIHSAEKEKATDKAKDLVRMAISRATLLEAIPSLSVSVNKSALVIGGGVAGMTAALSLADQGFGATLVEKSATLGGSARDVHHTWSGEDVQGFLKNLIGRVSRHPRITVLTQAEVVDASGFVGNFETRVQAGENSHSIQHGVVIVATGGQAAGTEEYLYGKHPSVTRWHDLENHPEKLAGAGSVVFIQCVGSRDEKRPYCSRICCTASVSQAIAIKEKQPDTDVFVIYRDIRTFGEREVLYKKAREKGVIFIRYSLEKKPVVTETPDGLEVRVFDPILQKELLIHADLVNLATAIEPSAKCGYRRVLQGSRQCREVSSWKPMPSCGPWILHRTVFLSAVWPIIPSRWMKASARQWRRQGGLLRFFPGPPFRYPRWSLRSTGSCASVAVCAPKSVPLAPLFRKMWTARDLRPKTFPPPVRAADFAPHPVRKRPLICCISGMIKSLRLSVRRFNAVNY